MTTNDANFWIASYRIAGKFGGEKFVGDFGESYVMNLSIHQTFLPHGNSQGNLRVWLDVQIRPHFTDLAIIM